jgi:hypothetical protein
MIPWAAALLLLVQAAETPRPRRSLALAVVPLSFAEREASTTLAKDLVVPLADYFRASSQGAFEVAGRVWDPVRVPAARSEVRREALAGALRSFVGREGPAVLETCDAVCFAAPGGLGLRGSPLWPHRDVLEVGGRKVDYVVVPSDAGPRGVAALAHEVMHLLGIEDKYDDDKADVGAACILGTGFDPRRPPPPCADCRVRLGWTKPLEADPSAAAEHVLARGAVLRVPLAPGEALLLELREDVLAWHVGGGKRIELVAQLAAGGGHTPV